MKTGDIVMYIGPEKAYKNTDVEIIDDCVNNAFWRDYKKVKTYDGIEHFVHTKMLMTHEEYYIHGGYERLKETAYEAGSEPPPVPVDCQCGAKHTRNPNLHTHYCPLSGGKYD